MEMTYETFLDSVRRRGGVDTAEQAEQISQATCRVLGEVLVDSDRAALAAELPEVLRRALCSREPNQDYDLAVFYERVSADEQVHAGRAREMAQVVGHTLARAIDAELLKRLRLRLPDEFGELFVNAHDEAGAPQDQFDHRAQANERTLARGKPGSDHPVSESRPREGHLGSIAAQDDPYHDTDIATGHESTDEDDNTLAGGRPGSERPLSDTHEE